MAPLPHLFKDPPCLFTYLTPHFLSIFRKQTGKYKSKKLITKQNKQ